MRQTATEMSAPATGLARPIPAPDQEPPYRQSVDAVLAALGTDSRLGLAQAEARRRLDSYGKNELAEGPVDPAWRKVLAQFSSMLVVLLLVAASISGVLWMIERSTLLPYEAMTILAVVLLNAGMGYLQQVRAERAVAALRHMSAATVVVVRDGQRQIIDATGLVPGDLMLIEEGDTVAADARVTETTMLRMAEAPLTGESLPVSKTSGAIATEAGLADRSNLIFSGTSATYGRGRAVVTATGMRTEMGRLAALLQRTPTEVTPLQRELDRVGRLLGFAVIGVAIAMVATILLVQDVRGFQAIFQVLVLGVALAVAGVPEGLPAVVTAVLSFGVQRLARRNVIVRHLAAVETLGSATVIASDKTGTLTKNEMTVRRVLTASGGVDVGGSGYLPKGDIHRDGGGEVVGALRAELILALTAASCANNATLQEQAGRWSIIGDPTEGALIVAAAKVALENRTLIARFTRITEVPFSSERKLMTTVHCDTASPQRRVAFAKGAPDVLLGLCSHEQVGDEARELTDARRAEIVESNEALARTALRTLGVATRDLLAGAGDGPIGAEIERGLTFLGLIGMLDPPRPEASEAVARARTAGIRAVMITGDHPKTAVAIAAELGLASDAKAVTGAEIAAMSDDALDRLVPSVSVYARVDPEHKLRIVRALQRGGAVVAMTGDGVNDAPALKAADIGVAMGITGTDVSKEAADIVLSDDNFASIVAAVEEGRGVYANIQKFLRYMLSSNFGEVLTMFFGVLLADLIGLMPEPGDHLMLPLLATQILWMNLVTDGAPALALGVDPVDPGTMMHPPRRRGESIITGRMWRGIMFVAIVMAAGTLGVLDAALPGGLIEGSGDIRYAQTMAFTTLTMFQLFNVINARSDHLSAFNELFSNRWLWAAIGLSLLLHAAVLYVPPMQQAFSTVALSAADWAICTGVASSVLWLRELTKLANRHRRAGQRFPEPDPTSTLIMATIK